MDSIGEIRRSLGPKRRDRMHYSYDESVDEPAPLIESETTDVEKETPADETEPVERVKDQEESTTPPAFGE